ncbi:uncharacterized protein LOC144142805 isoform X4 [Haemaphysalis longicornis]
MACEVQWSYHGNVVALISPNGKVLAKIYSWAHENFVKCEKCGFVPESFYKYNGQHNICSHCAIYSGYYLSVPGNITTEITKHEVPNASLKHASIQCPACCRLFQWEQVTDHIQEKHPDLWKEGNAHTWSDTQMDEDPKTRKRVVPPTPNPPSSIAEASPSSESDTDHVPLVIDTQASTSSESDADPVPLVMDMQASTSSESDADPVPLVIDTQAPTSSGCDADPVPLVIDTQASTSSEAHTDRVPLDIHTQKASTSSESHSDRVPLDIHTQGSASLEPQADPVPLDIRTQQWKHETSTNDTHPIDIARLDRKIYCLNEENLELKSTVQKLLSFDEENRTAMAISDQKLNSAITFRMTIDEVLKKHISDCQVIPVFRHTWTLRPYSALRPRLLFNKATLSTGVLSVNTPGYKVELTISITGHTCEWRRPWLKDELCCPLSALQVAFMVKIHPGEDDDLLVWPFANKIALLLVNHLDKEKSILLHLESGEANSDCLKKPERGILNQGFGFPRVISVQELETPEKGFLFQDSIVFKFTLH